MFENEAPRYWERGISVMPVNGKRPVVDGWSDWSNKLPGEDLQTLWRMKYRGLGIGLIAGPQSQIVGIDIDTEDEVLITAIERALPPSPWVRKGKRGKMLAFKYRGERTFSLKDAQKREIVACISEGKQFVLPPSIHPDTGRPYVANCELLDVIDALPVLPENIEDLLVAVLHEGGIDTAKTTGRPVVTQWVSAGGRDNEITRQAGAFAYEIVRGGISLLEAINLMSAKIESFTEQVAGDAISVEIGVDKLIRMLRKDVFEGRKTLPKGWDEGVSDELKTRLGIDDFGDSTRRFAFDEITALFDEELGRPGVFENNLETLRVVEKTLIRIAANADLTAVEEHGLLSYVSQKTAARAVISSMRKRVGELRRGDVLGETHSEAAGVILKELNQYGEVRFSDSAFWQWGGDHWKPLTEAEILQTIIQKCVGMPAVRKQSDYTGVLKTLSQMVTKPLRVEEKIVGVNFVNGFLTENLEIVPHHPDFGCTYIFSYPYEKELASECPMFLKMLETYWGDDIDYLQKVEALQQAMAATIFGLGTFYQRVFCLKGVPNSGKSRILRLIRALMPPGTVSDVTPEKFGEKFESTDLAGKLLNMAGELDAKQRIPGRLFKMIVEGSEMQGQLKGKQVFTYRPMAAHWYGSNHLPMVDSPDGGFERRWLFFEFNKPIPQDKVIGEIQQIVIDKEAAAIMAWVVEGLPKLRSQGFYTLPPSHFEVSDDMMRKADSVRSFLEHLQQVGRVRLGVEAEGSTTPLDLLHFQYAVYCRSTAHVPPVGLPVFTERMVEHGTKLGFKALRVAGKGIVALQSFIIAEKKVAA